MVKDVLKKVEEMGVHISSIHGDEIVVLCPVHPDHNPSMNISISTGLCHCFSCGYGGTLQDLERRIVGMERDFTPLSMEKTPLSRTAPQINEELFSSLPLALGHGEILRRGLTNDSVREWRIKCSGLFLIIPAYKDGYVMGYICRSLVSEFAKYLYTKGFSKSSILFGADKASSGEVAVVEGAFDAIKVRQSGYSSVAVLGMHASREQINLLGRYSSVMLLFDNDGAGRIATEKVARELVGKVDVFIPNFSLYYSHDPSDMGKEEIDEIIQNKISYLKAKLKKEV